MPEEPPYMVPPGFAEELEKLYPWQERLFWSVLADTKPVVARERVMPEGEPADLTVTRLSAFISVPDELLMDAGVIPDMRPARPPMPWRRRLHWRIALARTALAYRAFEVIAGYEVPEE